MALLDDIRKNEYLSLLGDKLQGLLDVPTSAARFMVNPTAVIDTATGKTAMPKEKGFAEAATGLPKRENLTVLDPANRAYMEGYSIGEPFNYAAMALPFASVGATKLSDKLVQAITGNPLATGSKVIDYASMPFGNAVVSKSPNTLITEGLLDTSYRGSHTAPNAKVYGATLDDLTTLVPKDVYTPRGKQLYGIGNPQIDSEWFTAALKAKNKPDAEIEIFRAVPKGVKDINSGDWITTSKTYADWHGENVLNGEYDIISKKVKAKTLSSEGYPYEFGYNPE